MTRYELVVSDKDLVVDHIALRFIRYNLYVFGNRYVLLGTTTTSGRKGFPSHNRLRMNLHGHTLNGLEQTSTNTIRQTCSDRIRHGGHYIRRCLRLLGDT